MAGMMSQDSTKDPVNRTMRATRDGRGGFNVGGRKGGHRGLKNGSKVGQSGRGIGNDDSTGDDRGGFNRENGKKNRLDGQAARPSNHKWRSPRPKPDLSQNPLGKPLFTVNTADITNAIDDNRIAKIADCRYVASYNWMNEASPTIMVPGKPPKWTPLHAPQRLKEDEGDFLRDSNAARFPTYPMEPAVQAILKQTPEFPTSDVNIFACGPTLGHLLRFVRGIRTPFRLGIEMIGNTVFFTRKENSPTEVIEGVRGYGHTFPNAYTMWDSDVKGSETHQRIIQYSFGGLEVMVRFECDGYLCAPEIDELLSHKLSSSDDGLMPACAATPISRDVPQTSKAAIHIKSGGVQIPQSSIFDLKTRSQRYKTGIDMSNYLPVLYLKQIPNFIVAYHNGHGLFQPENIHVQNLERPLQAWETGNEKALKKLVGLLRKIIEVANANGNGLLDIYYAGSNHLQIHQQSGEESHALPLALRQRWARTQRMAQPPQLQSLPNEFAQVTAVMIAEEVSVDGTLENQA